MVIQANCRVILHRNYDCCAIQPLLISNKSHNSISHLVREYRVVQNTLEINSIVCVQMNIIIKGHIHAFLLETAHSHKHFFFLKNNTVGT